jgi:hypothetical protein
VIVADGWKLDHFKNNPVFLWAHDYTRPPIGKGVSVSNGNGKLKISVEFVPPEIDPFAEHIRQLYANGFMRTVSVGFTTYKVEDLTDEEKKQRPEMPYGRRLYGELLEVSAVPVPANPMALQNGFMEAMVKSFGPPPQMFKAVEKTDTAGLDYLETVLSAVKTNLATVNVALKTGGYHG